jgi:hypothetical protein
MEQEKYEEKIVIPIYDPEMNEGFDIFNESKEYHLSTLNKIFEYKDILAITSKMVPENAEYCNCSRGGAFIFVRDREIPYLTRDDFTVKVIKKKLDENPLSCFSELYQMGNSRILAKRDECLLKDNNLILPNGVELRLSNDAIEVMLWMKDLFTKGSQSLCRAIKKRLRKKMKNK